MNWAIATPIFCFLGTILVNAWITSNARAKTAGAIENAITGLGVRVTQTESDIRELNRQQQVTSRDLASLSGSPRAKAAAAHGRL